MDENQIFFDPIPVSKYYLYDLIKELYKSELYKSLVESMVESMVLKQRDSNPIPHTIKVICTKNRIRGYAADFCAVDDVQNFVKENPEHVDKTKYPHTCPKCQCAAYIGFMSVDCSNTKCC